VRPGARQPLGGALFWIGIVYSMETIKPPEKMRLVYLQDTNEYRLSISFLYPLQHGFQSFAAGFLLFRCSARANLVTTDGTGEGEVMGK
jgi:hypothetical protein